ncbi:MAG: hypothetical protein KBE09_03255 [Candidatus Pacebacteria bacterium]|nr:hypothetical protein [Candidatus Paceibacterota bacterium]
MSPATSQKNRGFKRRAVVMVKLFWLAVITGISGAVVVLFLDNTLAATSFKVVGLFLSLILISNLTAKATLTYLTLLPPSKS